MRNRRLILALALLLLSLLVVSAGCLDTTSESPGTSEDRTDPDDVPSSPPDGAQSPEDSENGDSIDSADAENEGDESTTNSTTDTDDNIPMDTNREDAPDVLEEDEKTNTSSNASIE